LPKLHYVIVDGTGGGVSVFIAADSIDQLRPSDEAVPIQKKKLEGFELMRSESHLRAVSNYFDCLKSTVMPSNSAHLVLAGSLL
jgi:hypothetical protein